MDERNHFFFGGLPCPGGVVAVAAVVAAVVPTTGVLVVTGGATTGDVVIDGPADGDVDRSMLDAAIAATTIPASRSTPTTATAPITSGVGRMPKISRGLSCGRGAGVATA